MLWFFRRGVNSAKPQPHHPVSDPKSAPVKKHNNLACRLAAGTAVQMLNL